MVPKRLFSDILPNFSQLICNTTSPWRNEVILACQQLWQQSQTQHKSFIKIMSNHSSGCIKNFRKSSMWINKKMWKKMVKRQMLMKINAKLHKFSCNRQDISLIIHGACAAASGRPGTPHHTHMKLSCFWAGHNAVILVLILLIRQQTTITISLCPSATSFLVL